MPFSCFDTVFIIIVIFVVVVVAAAAAAAAVVVWTFHSTHDFNVRIFYPVLLVQLHSACQCHRTDL
jgi:flagellar basal body-associated protein FliL